MMVELYSSGGTKKGISKKKLRILLKKLKKSYKYIPFYKNKIKKDHEKQSLDADKLLDEKREDL